jgi:hypothetical protein
MEQKATSLLAAFKNTNAFGTKYAADFPAGSVGAAQFGIINNAVTTLGSLGTTQVSGVNSVQNSVLAKAIGRQHLHDDLIAINDAAHSLVLTGNTALAGKFPMPPHHGDQALLNSARAFANDAAPFTALFTSVGLPADFITHLNADITMFETANSSKGSSMLAQGGATGGIVDAAHKAAIALHVLDTVVKNTYKSNPQRLAEWTIASHVEKHTPVTRAKPAPAPAPAPGN